MILAPAAAEKNTRTAAEGWHKSGARSQEFSSRRNLGNDAVGSVGTPRQARFLRTSFRRLSSDVVALNSWLLAPELNS
jgi:hypothetical protein